MPELWQNPSPYPASSTDLVASTGQSCQTGGKKVKRRRSRVKKTKHIRRHRSNKRSRSKRVRSKYTSKRKRRSRKQRGGSGNMASWGANALVSAWNGENVGNRPLPFLDQVSEQH